MACSQRFRTAPARPECLGIGSLRLADVDQEALVPDLHIGPVDRNVKLGGQLRGAEQAGHVGSLITLSGHLDAGAETNPLHGNQKDFLCTVGRAVPFAGENGGNLVIGHAGAGEIEKAVSHLATSRKLGDRVDLHLIRGRSRLHPATRS